jgi:hypothetical protein
MGDAFENRFETGELALDGSRPNPDAPFDWATPTGFGAAPLLSELDMWVRCFERFFDIRNHPFSEIERQEITRHDFSEELRIVRNAALRMIFLCAEVGGAPSNASGLAARAARLNGHRLSTQWEANGVPTPPAPLESLALLGESLSDLRIILDGLIRVTPNGFHAFASVGKIANREIRRSRLNESLTYHRLLIPNRVLDQERLQRVLDRIANDFLKQDIRRVFSEFARLLGYLDFIQYDLQQDRPLKGALLIFTLINAEARLFLEFLETRPLKIPNLPTPVSEAIDATIYALQMELRKVYGRELVGFIHLRQAPPIYVKVENAHGLLRDCFQQSLVTLAQIFDPTFDGALAFSDFQTKLDQSLRLRSDIWRLLTATRRFEDRPDKTDVAPLIEELRGFRDSSLKYLMYKDWDEYERFLEDAISARSMDELTKIIHPLSTFLETLLGQINMRAVLANHPFDYPSQP